MKLAHIHNSFCLQSTDILTGRMMVSFGWARVVLSSILFSRQLAEEMAPWLSTWRANVRTRVQISGTHLNARVSWPVCLQFQSQKIGGGGSPQKETSRWATLVSSGFGRDPASLNKVEEWPRTTSNDNLRPPNAHVPSYRAVCLSTCKHACTTHTNWKKNNNNNNSNNRPWNARHIYQVCV